MKVDDIYALILRWVPKKYVRFFVRTKKGQCKRIENNEPLKEFENNPESFTLTKHAGLLFSYIQENFDGDDAAELILEVPGEMCREVEEHFRLETCKYVNKSIAVKCIVKELAIDNTKTDDSQKAVCKIKKIAVAGKLKSGKTELIQACIKSKTFTKKSGYQEFTAENGDIWYELDGIDVGGNDILEADKTLEMLADVGLTNVVYCFCSMTGKIEGTEQKLLHDFRKKHPDIHVCAVVTMSVNNDADEEFAQLISASLLSIPVIVTLAREYHTRAGYIAPFGIDRLINFIGEYYE